MMKKTGVQKGVVKKNLSKTKKTSNPVKKLQTEKVLIENFIALQKVNTNLAIKFDKLSNQISSLLELFEVSAKTLAEKDLELKKENRDNKQIVEKIDNLIEQNRTIARGVALVHEGNYEQKSMMPPRRSLPSTPQTKSIGQYQKSISRQDPQTKEVGQSK